MIEAKVLVKLNGDNASVAGWQSHSVPSRTRSD